MLAKVTAKLAGAVTLVDSAATTAETVTNLLVQQDLACTVRSSATHVFLATDSPERFARVGAIFLGSPPEGVELVDLTDVQ